MNENREFYAEILKDDQYIPVAMEVKDLRKVKNELYLVDFFVQYKDGHSEEVKDFKIITKHIIPNLSSYLIVVSTLSIPGMILGESTISFLGLGIKEPMTSWGLLLKDAQSLTEIAIHPWLIIPGAFIMISVLGFNFVGDALRDAIDPYRTVEKV